MAAATEVEGGNPGPPDRLMRRLRWWALFAGPGAALLVHALLPASYPGPGQVEVEFSVAGRATAAVATWMAIWWVTEAIPIYATALLPLGLFPLLGASSIEAAAAPYAHPLIFLFMGGFILALAMQRFGLDRRISLSVLRWVGSGPRAIVGAFMVVTACLSMWISNTATCVMMLPIALGVLGVAGEDDPGFRASLLLGIAYAASIGGIGTLVGTPPNLFLASYAGENLDVSISFARWMVIGLPLVAVFLPLAWWLLTGVLHPIRLRRVERGHGYVQAELARLGPVRAPEWAVLAVFAATALAWITRPLLVELRIGDSTPLAGLTDAGIAMLAVLSLFVIPADRSRHRFLMSWRTAAKLPWGILVLFGGGLSLARAIRSNGVGELLGASVASWQGVSPWLLLVGVVTLTIFLTEVTSNTATAATLIPILAGLAPGLGVEPVLLAVAAAMAASCAFMLPVATPPNAVVFGSQQVELREMLRAGLWLNLIGIVLISALCHALVIPLLGSGS